MSPDNSEMAEMIRAAQEEAYDQALEDQRDNSRIPTAWMCACHKRPRWNGVHTPHCWQKPIRPYKANPYRKR